MLINYQLVRQYADTIINNPAIPNQRNDEAINKLQLHSGGYKTCSGSAQDILNVYGKSI
jgi:hypothetical protein